MFKNTQSLKSGTKTGGIFGGQYQTQNITQPHLFNKDQQKRTSLFTGLQSQKNTQGIFNNPQQVQNTRPMLFNPLNKSQTMSSNPLFDVHKPQIQSQNLFNPQLNVQKQQQLKQIQQLKKDLALQKQTTQRLLLTIKDMQSKNNQLQKRNKTLQTQIHIIFLNYPQIQRLNLDQNLENLEIKNLSGSLGNIQTQNKFMHNNPLHSNTLLKMPPIPNPLNFKYKSNLFSSSVNQASILNQDHIFPTSFTEKIFYVQDGYAIQAYIAFNAFYNIKHMIVQKIGNKYGCLILAQNQSQKLFKQNNPKGTKNWFLFHQNSNHNIISRNMTTQLAKYITNMMSTGKQQASINIPINISKFIEINQKQINIYNPEWTQSMQCQVQLYNYWNYQNSNSEIKQIIKHQINRRFMKKDSKTAEKNQIVWFDEKNGTLHLHREAIQSK